MTAAAAPSRGAVCGPAHGSAPPPAARRSRSRWRRAAAPPGATPLRPRAPSPLATPAVGPVRGSRCARSPVAGRRASAGRSPAASAVPRKPALPARPAPAVRRAPHPPARPRSSGLRATRRGRPRSRRELQAARRRRQRGGCWARRRAKQPRGPRWSPIATSPAPAPPRRGPRRPGRAWPAPPPQPPATLSTPVMLTHSSARPGPPPGETSGCLERLHRRPRRRPRSDRFRRGSATAKRPSARRLRFEKKSVLSSATATGAVNGWAGRSLVAT